MRGDKYSPGGCTVTNGVKSCKPINPPTELQRAEILTVRMMNTTVPYRSLFTRPDARAMGSRSSESHTDRFAVSTLAEALTSPEKSALRIAETQLASV